MFQKEKCSIAVMIYKLTGNHKLLYVSVHASQNEAVHAIHSYLTQYMNRFR